MPAENIMDAEGLIRLQRKHCSIRQLLAEGLIPPSYAEQFTTLTTVRNPYDSLVSLYVKKRDTYQELAGATPPRGFTRCAGTLRILRVLPRKIARFLRGMAHESLRGGSHRETARGRGHGSLYGRYTEGVEVVMRFERLQQDFEAVMRRLGVDGDMLDSEVFQPDSKAGGRPAPGLLHARRRAKRNRRVYICSRPELEHRLFV